MQRDRRTIATMGLALGGALLAHGATHADDSAEDIVFTLQGRLVIDGVPVTSAPGTGYDFWFQLWDAAEGGTALTGPMPCEDVPIEAGLFSVSIGLDPIFDDAPRWLSIVVDADPDEGLYREADLGRRLIGRAPQAAYAEFADVADNGVAIDPVTGDSYLNGTRLAINKAEIDPDQNVVLDVGGFMRVDGDIRFLGDRTVFASGELNVQSALDRPLRLNPFSGGAGVTVGGAIPPGVPALTVDGSTLIRGDVRTEAGITLDAGDVALQNGGLHLPAGRITGTSGGRLFVSSVGGESLRLNGDVPFGDVEVGIDGQANPAFISNGTGLFKGFLVTEGPAVVQTTFQPGIALNVGGFVQADDFIPPPSDGRLKHDVADLGPALATVLELSPVRYRWREGTPQHDYLGDRIELGFIAQAVRALVPEAVQEDGDGFLRLDYDQLVPVMVRGMQEQQELIDGQAERIADLEAAAAERDELRERLERLEALIGGEQ